MNTVVKKNFRLSIIAGIFFSIFWGSASTVSKFTLQYIQPWVLVFLRLFAASIIMLIIAHVILKYKFPQRKHWKKLIICGLLNLSIFQGMFTYGLNFVPGGLGTLMTSTIPIFITLFTWLWLKKRITLNVIFSIILCLIGVVTASWNFIKLENLLGFGILILVVGIISNAAGAVYFVGVDWNGMNLITFNAWQSLLASLFILPLCIYHYDSGLNDFNLTALVGIGWLAIFISITAILLWLFILKQNPIRASFWLFLCPIVGFSIAAYLLHEPITALTAIGVIFVISGLYLSQRTSKKDLIEEKPAASN